MYTNQMTIEEANFKSLNNITLTANDIIYASADDWGEEYVGTMETWELEIPAIESEAKKTCWHDWFLSHDENLSWSEYRACLLEQLIKIEIVEDDD